MSGENASGGISFCGMLTVLFIGLKLTGYIDWSWPWVLSPLWIGVAVVLAIAAVIGAFALLVVAIEAIAERRMKP